MEFPCTLARRSVLTSTIGQLIHRFKNNWTRELAPEAIERACRDQGHAWRDRLLNPVRTVQLLLLQVMYGNAACQHLPHLAAMEFAAMEFTASAYCQARLRLPLGVLQQILERIADAFRRSELDQGRWRGHRTFLVDGSGFSMPDTRALRKHFGQPPQQKPGCGFPVGHLVAMFHAGTGLLTKVNAASMHTSDFRLVGPCHSQMRPGDVLLADSGFCAFVHMALLLKQDLHAVFRMHHARIVDFTPGRPYLPHGQSQPKGGKRMPRSQWLRQLGVLDQTVQWIKPHQPPKWMSAEAFAALPESITVRELRYRVAPRGFRVKEVTLATTLLDAEAYPLEELAKLYRVRWRVETYLASLKRTMKMDVLRCKTPDGVLKELAAFVVVYNLVRSVMLEASHRQRVEVDRISFIDALRWLTSWRPGAALRKLKVNPHRPNRLEPRVRKRRPKEYPLMQIPRNEWKQQVAAKRLAA